MSYADRNIPSGANEFTDCIFKYTYSKNISKVGSSFTWYLIANSPSYKPITIEGIWNKNVYQDIVNSEERKYIPLYYNQTIQSISHKTIDNDTLPKFDVKTSSDLHKYAPYFTNAR